VILECFISF